MSNASSSIGKVKTGSLLYPYQKRLVEVLLLKVPRNINSVHMTYMTVVWTILVLITFWMSSISRSALILVNLVIIMQFITDALDGALGRTRGEGLVKWGYFMDHLLDYVFGASIIIGYGILLPSLLPYLYIILFAVGGIVVCAHLAVGAGQEFGVRAGKISPTELILAILIFNTLILVAGLSLLKLVIILVSYLSVLVFIFVAYTLQKRLMSEDQQINQSGSKNSS
ncbi:CDP-alcohol phosphatidyltransferase family protein [Patescibacteria group bacterium]